MASKTNQTQYRRKLRLKNQGNDRKKNLESKGTTPAFPVHTAEVDAAAPKAQVSPRSE
jgi:hypothetical protein